MALKGDFIGFTFNGKHSSDLGIIRTSEGSRYSEDLLPTIEDKTVPVPGGDGVYYFGSYYRQKIFNISIAFDKLTEKQFRELKSHFGNKQLGDLIFDEAPYKVYKVKVSGAPNLKYICFDEYEYKTNTGTNIETGTGTGTKDVVEIKKRVYKGEGTIQFVAFSPFARSRYKTLDKFVDNDFPNKSEWAEASGLPPIELYTTMSSGNYIIPLWNPGDIETDFMITIDFDANNLVSLSQIELYNVDEVSIEELHFNSPILSKYNANIRDDAIRINSKLNIIEGMVNGELSGNIYNEYIKTGTFFKIPVFEYIKDIDPPYLNLMPFTDTTINKPELEFDYLYY